MLERVALHQTRLRTPGLALDARGIALGSHGLLLFPSIDRLVAFFAVLTSSQSLDEMASSMRIEVVKSKLGVRQVALVFRIESSDRMDAATRVAALVSGHAFTGSGRHWVQYRDAGAPFGYDVVEVTATTENYVLYHRSYTQALDVERTIDPKRLFLRLALRRAPETVRDVGPRWVLAEAGVGGALAHYFRRSSVGARVGVVESPPASELDEGPTRRFLFELASPPPRILPLVASTPGMSLFAPVAAGAAVEVGFRHPIQLRAIPAFRGPALVLFRGRNEPPIEIDPMPALGPVGALGRFEVLRDEEHVAAAASAIAPALRVPLRLVPSSTRGGEVTATWIPARDLPLFRRLVYALGPDTLRRSTIAILGEGAFLRLARGADVLPIGLYHRSIGDGIFAPVGWDTAPSVGAEVAARALDVPEGMVAILRPGETRESPARAWVVPESAFVSLESAVIQGPAWAPLDALGLDREMSAALPDVELVVEDPGVRPMRDVAGPTMEPK